MRAGMLRHEIIPLRPRSFNDCGDEVKSYTELEPEPAHIQTGVPMEIELDGAPVIVQGVKVRVRAPTQFTPRFRGKYVGADGETRYLRVDGVADVEERGRWVHLTCVHIELKDRIR